ncbi:leucyl-tRNA synthetase [Xylariomycetidae sp. FL2044]|nr:leucyl-tRNA synthetase [Xylariomycetidae sp. FL2044]
MYPLARKASGQLGPCLKPASFHALASRTALPRRSYATHQQLDLTALDLKWRRIWAKAENFEHTCSKREREQHRQRTGSEPPQPQGSRDANKYILPMFPYPSGNLHLGHLRVYTIADVVARFRRLQGFNVKLPMGWDAFGLPAENAAIERDIDPKTWTRGNIKHMKEQLEVMNGSFDWNTEFATCDADFYQQTQKIFLLLREHGLVSQKEALVNWDPVENTVLANEQVDSDGRSWRSGAKVEQRLLKQWFFRITKFKEALLRDLDSLALDGAWPARVLTMQRNWLGRKVAATFEFSLRDPGGSIKVSNPWYHVKVFTTRPETIFAAQFIALSPSHPLVMELAKTDPVLRKRLEQTSDLQDPTAGFRIENLYAHNHVHHALPRSSLSPKPTLPVYVASYVRGDYQTGAVMGVPAHDARDFAFWKRYHPCDPVKYAVTPDPDGSVAHFKGEPYLGSGYMTSLASILYKMSSEEAAKEIISRMRSSTRTATGASVWNIRDWLISRQRYWGTPIPIIHCLSCGPQPVPDDQLPVRLPAIETHWADGRRGNPLESATSWINVPCPKCSRPAKRDTDTMDTFVDSSWYYMRFADRLNMEGPISKKAAEQWLPVDIYIGGVEHAILHLLYARFIYKAVMGILHPIERPVKEKKGYSKKRKRSVHSGMEPATEPEELFSSSHEPFKRLITQGMVHGRTYKDPENGRFLKPDEVDLSNPKEPKVIASGAEATVTFEKMSKSKYNGVDPTSFIAQYGADATRAHMLFQAPVSEVLNWDGEKITGITRWLRRLHAYVQALASDPERLREESDKLDYKSWLQQSEESQRFMSKGRAEQWRADVEVWRATQQTLASVTSAYTKVYTLNTAVSSLMGLTNTLIGYNKIASGWMQQKAAVRLLRMMAPITPAFAEECFQILFPEGRSVFDQGKSGWPGLDLTRLPDSMVMNCAVQINGKVRCVVQIPARQFGGGDDADLNSWLTEEILKDPEAAAKLKGNNDIRNALKVFPIRTTNGAVVNYVVEKQWA